LDNVQNVQNSVAKHAGALVGVLSNADMVGASLQALRLFGLRVAKQCPVLKEWGELEKSKSSVGNLGIPFAYPEVA